jgi:signal transduction histidine kinase
MPSAKSDARWRDAIRLTFALWLFVALTAMPYIIVRHSGEGILSVLLDESSVLFSICLGLGVFAVFRATIEWPDTVRGIILAAAALGASFAQTAFDLSFTAWMAHNSNLWRTLPYDLAAGYEKAFKYLLVFGINLAFFQLAFAHRRTLRDERQLTDARTTAQHAQLEALRYQLNPHFLFNTLNSISSLIVTRRNEDAEHMTNKLSSFLRSSLSCDPGGLIPLDDELAMIEEYLDIEAVRFGKRLNVDICCESDAGDALIPGFLVQPLVENAIKHGVAPSRETVTVSVTATLEDGVLCIKVENDNVPKDDRITAGGPGVGLANVRRRLQAVFGAAASLTTQRTGAGFTATICIPSVTATS